MAIDKVSIAYAAAVVALCTKVSSAPAAADGPADTSDQLTTITVTAQRREENIQKVGESVLALSPQEFGASRVMKPVDLMQLTPALSSVNTTTDGTPVFAIRGVGLDDYNPNNSSGTAVYLDNIYATSPMFLSGQMYDVQRVEVIEGPQATLYGRNATGGAINIISNMPARDFGAYLTAGFGRWSDVNFTGAVTGSLGDDWMARVAVAVANQSDGWQTDINTGRDVGKINRQAARGILEYAPTGSRLSVLFNFHGTHDTSLPSSPQSYGNAAYAGPAAAPLLDTGTDDPSKVRVGALAIGRDENGAGVGVTVNYELDAARLSLISGWDRYSRRVTDNVDGIPGPSFDLFQNDETRQTYAELRLVSQRPIFNDLLDWTVGASYSGSHFEGGDSSDQSAPYVGQYEIPPNYTTPGLSVAQADYTQITDSWSVYSQTTTHLTSAFRLVLGGRYSQDKVGFDGISTETGSAAGGVLFNGVGATVAALDEERTERHVSYRAGVEFDAAENVLLYANVATAFKAGTYYAAPALDPAAWRYVRPEKVQGLEGGIKSTWLDRKLMLNIAAFDYKYDDRQSIIIFISPASGFPVGSLANVPESRITGGEFEFTVRPVAALEISAGVSYLSARVTKTLNDVGGAPLYTNVPDGTRLAQAPQNSYLLSATYHLPQVVQWRPSINLNGRWTGSQRSSISDPNGYYGPFKQLNARLSVVSPTAAWEVAAWGQNLTSADSTTYASTDFWGGVTIYRQMPLSYGVELTRHF